VIEDGGGEAREAWRAAAEASQGHTRMVESDNVHEIRAYRRGFELARGAFLVMLQDDDLPPPYTAWLAPALRLMELHPRLALLSCTDGFTTPEIFGDHYGRATPIPTMDSRAPQVPFMFVAGANSAPVVYRAAPYHQIEGFSLEFSEPGEPGIGFETEISLRLWAAQWQSGILDCGAMRRGVGGHGTLRSEEKHALRKAVWAANQQRMNSSFPLDFRRQLSAQVRQLNAEEPIVQRPKGAICGELKARMQRRSHQGDGRVSKKGAKLVEPLYYGTYRCHRP